MTSNFPALSGSPSPPSPDGDEVLTGGSQNRAFTAGPLSGVPAKVGAALFVILVWFLVKTIGLPDYAPSPVGVAKAAASTLSSGAFLDALAPTLLAVAVGLVLGGVLGTMIGLIIGRVPWLRWLVAPYLSGLYAMPMIALVPTMTIWLGYTSETRFVMVVLAAVLPCAVSVADGARTLPVGLVEVARVLRMGRRRTISDLVLPATLPSVIAGLQVAIGRCIVTAVAVEILANLQGLGTFILTDARSFHQNEAFVAVLVLAILGLAARVLIGAVLKMVAPWQAP